MEDNPCKATPPSTCPNQRFDNRPRFGGLELPPERKIEVPRIVFLNGPPHSGKDTAGEILMGLISDPVECRKMAEPLKEATHAFFAALRGDVPFTRLPGFYEHRKDEPLSDFFSLSPRRAYIEVSERLLKPVFGTDFFGRRFVDRLAGINPLTVVIVTDCGFVPEVQVVLGAVGADRCTLVRLHRPGCSFDSDSRSYIGGFETPIRELDIDNDGTLPDLRIKLHAVLPFILGEELPGALAPPTSPRT